jgi:hypothetical protein
MPDYLFIDTEFGGLPDRQFHESRFGLTEISAAAFYVTPGWASVEIRGHFNVHIRPNPDLVYEDDSLKIQSGWLADTWENVVEWDAFTDTNQGEPIAQTCLSPQAPTLADAFYFWLELHGRDEKEALEGFKKWSTHFFGDEYWKVSAWGHNVEMDLRMLTCAIDRHFEDRYNEFGSNEMMPCNRAGRCSVNLFRVMRDLGLHNRFKANLDTVIAFYGIEIAEADRHTSKGDVAASVLGIQNMMQHLKSGTFRHPASSTRRDIDDDYYSRRDLYG